ncbi:MAG: transferrin-binding protein-like solute binding protein [Alphaproteobacteria bacterium]|nr:transferrin-binding protein-like solute binding protein [Alphaproteobacteria bacterium]
MLADALGNDVEFASLKVRPSPDRMTAYVTIDGTTMVMAADPDTVEPGGGLYGDAGNPSVPTMTLSNLATYSLVGFTEDAIGGFGYAGIETPTANLPVGDVVFSGFWGGTIYPNLDGIGPGFDPDDLPLLGGGVAGGFVEMTLNFDTGDLAGTFDGDFNDFGGVTETGGTITGSTQGNGITGTFNFDGGAYSGSAGFVGKAYGDDADSINGVMGSTLTNDATGKPHAFGGTFELEPGGL